ncbi:GatB/YqeY domain-containing protein [Phaeospirillum tilakii]|uniref:GatB/YqeY domain-containing protein n=1 Tax=Phaeospirillum tilakii TaxID=741673 RepID=A0ABW5CF93_9PROT
MLRGQLNDALKTAMLGKDTRTVATVRLILAALKDRDIAARPRGLSDGIPDEEILQMLQSMIKQRRESIVLYEQGGRLELAEQEAEEITVIERFLPRQMTADEVEAAIGSVIADLGATGIKDMGRIMAALKERYAGRMDFARASAAVKARLGAA